jgi:hypothetical protein
MKSAQIKKITEKATDQLVAALQQGHSQTLILAAAHSRASAAGRRGRFLGTCGRSAALPRFATRRAGNHSRKRSRTHRYGMPGTATRRIICSWQHSSSWRAVWNANLCASNHSGVVSRSSSALDANRDLYG